MTLYEIDNKIYKLLLMQREENIADKDIADSLEALLMDKYDKCVGVALAIKNMMKDIEAFRREEQNLSARRRSIEKKAEWLKGYLADSLDGECIENDPRVRVTYKLSERVIIENPELLPEEYLHIPEIKYEPSKNDIKEALKAGEEVPGAYLQSFSNIQIK